MPRFPIDDSNIKEGKIFIYGSDHKHISKVLRFGKDDLLTLFTRDKEYLAKIEEINSKVIILDILESLYVCRESKLGIHLFQGVLKSSNMDFIVQKCTELGVSSITPVINERSQINKTNKIKRWIRITEESCKQCGRNKPVIINELEYLETILKGQISKGENILLDINSDINFKSYLKSIKKPPQSINIFIGPEGGFSPGEISILSNKDITPLSFGPRVLRAETAAISAVSVIQFLFGDMQS